ncbi:hypothetical protein B0I37DRAFT_310832 [Chaetomium sp. MPI-CAGE-AT-0009]|nr:hypothetical protein B0I37DRAFT_310832 [Chaetomium sp. MPI-CAGE-AT-0009]
MMNHRLLPAVIAALLWAHTSHASAIDDFVGRGQIQVLNNTDVSTASIADRIGCMNARGELTLNDCAVFTRADASPNTLSTSAGNCTFQNPNMPLNTDSIYGQDSHAWFCGEGDWSKFDEYYYTIVSPGLPSHHAPCPLLSCGDVMAIGR